MQSLELHPVKLSILTSLRHAERARYSELLRPQTIESDAFKFHVRKLVKAGLIQKAENGEYHLTAAGKEFANNLNQDTRTYQKQPKLSVLLVIKDTHSNKYLFQQRLRQPHWGYWGFISGPQAWGEDVEQTAQQELLKQTGLTATFCTAGFVRQSDKDPLSGAVLEDKLFQVMFAELPTTASLSKYRHGQSQWLSINELESQAHYFEPTARIIQMVENQEGFIAVEVTRRLSDF